MGYALSLQWLPPPDQVALEADEVHLWCAALEQEPSRVEALSAVLSDEERERALRLQCPAARLRFAVGRSLLRRILSRYLAIPPCQLLFRSGPSGKPMLDGSLGAVHFNVSHSHELVLIALTLQGEVGVDVERLRPFANDMGMAERYFSPPECHTLQMLAPERRTEAFFHAWTRKEACLKALGVGLSYGLDRVEVTIQPEEPVRLLRLDGEEKRAACWSLRGLIPAPGYVGALALEGNGYRLIGWHWAGED